MASIMADDWHLFEDANIFRNPCGSVLDGEEEIEWNGLRVDEQQLEWSSCERSSLSFWSSDVNELLEIDELTCVNPLPSPLERLWVDFSAEFAADNNESVPVNNGSTIEKLPDSVDVSEVDACHEIDEVLRLLLQQETLPNFGDQVLTVDSSQLETLLSESVSFDDIVATCEVDHLEDVSETQEYEESQSDCDDREDESDWSYSGEKKRRCSVKPLRQTRTMPYRRPSGAVRFDRKKEQNKTAATRYRDRKRAEENENEIVCAELEKVNRQLRASVEAMSHEASVLRKLIVDIFRDGSSMDT